MNNAHKALFFIFTFLTSFFSFPIEVPAHQDASRIIIKTHEVRDELITILKKARQAEIAIMHADITCLTNQTVVGLLKEIAQKDKNVVSIHIDPEHSENQTFIEECASSYPQIKLKTSRQHGKRVLLAYKNYNEPSWQHIVHEGSYNPNNTQRGRRKNSEMALVTYDDTTYYEQHRELHNEGMLEDADGEYILPTTPRTREVYDTTLYRLIESLAERIHPEKGGTLYLGTMGYNNTALHTKLLAFCKHGGTVHMIVDYE